MQIKDAIYGTYYLKLKFQVKDQLKALIENLNNALKIYPDIKGSDYIKELFKEEQKNY